MSRQNPLKFYTDKLEKGEHFSLARYGDGELYCMWGRTGKNSNGCRYSPELRHALLDSMRHNNDSTFLYGLQRVLPGDARRIKREYPSVEWCDSEIFSEAVADGKLYPLIKQLKKMNLHFIANESLSEFLDKEFHSLHTIVSPSNAYDSELPITPVDGVVYLFSAGMASNAWISQLHGKAKCWLLDVGHIWDPFVGNMSRCDLADKTVDDILKNLHETTP